MMIIDYFRFFTCLPAIFCLIDVTRCFAMKEITHQSHVVTVATLVSLKIIIAVFAICCFFAYFISLRRCPNMLPQIIFAIDFRYADAYAISTSFFIIPAA